MTISLKTNEFHDLYQYMEYVSQFQDDLTVQLQTGSFHFGEKVLDFGDFMIFQFAYGQRLLDRFSILPGYLQFVFTAPDNDCSRWNGQNVSGNHLVAMHPGRENLAIIPPGFKAIGLLIETDTVVQESLLSERLSMQIRQPEKAIFYQNESVLFEPFYRQAIKLLASASDQERQLDCKSIALESRNWIMDTFRTILLDIETSQSSGTSLSRKTNNKRFRIFSRVVDLIEEQLTETFSIKQICNEIGTTPRTLQLILKEEVGLSPVQYITARKLHAIHQQICDADGTQIQISHLAQNYGFEHLSRFASKYKAMFHELPSATLKKNVDR